MNASSSHALAQATPASLEEFIHRTHGQHRFLVLDCYEGNFFEPALDHFQVEESKRFRMPVHTVEGGENDPLLAHLDNAHAEPLMQAAVQEAVKSATDSALGPRNVAALISSTWKPEHVAKNFAKAARIRRDARDRKSVAFRFFDPRVTHTLLRLFDPPQIPLLLGPIAYWGYVDFRGQFRLVENTSPRSSSSAVIHKEQLNALRRNATVQTALHRLQKLRADWPEDLDAVLDRQIQHAPKELHDADIINREADLATYAALCWLCDTGRADKQILNQMMAKRHDIGMPLKGILGPLLPEFF